MDALSAVLLFGFHDGSLLLIAVNLIALAYIAIPVITVIAWPIIGTTVVKETMRALFGWLPGFARESAADLRETVKKPPTDTHEG